MLLLGSSLVREVRREQAKIKGARRTERLPRWLRSWATAIFETSRHAFWWILLVGLVGLYLLPSEVQFFHLRRSLSFFDDPTEASAFLQTLWQVEAAVLALSITVIVFAFQAVSISGYNIKLYEFAQDIHLFPVLYVGIVGLVVGALVLLGFGNGAPAGGASSWAIIVSGSSFPLLALLFTNTVHALDPDELHRRRLVRIREEVSRAVEREIFERIALNLLESRCQAAGIELQPFLAGSPPPGSENILAPSAGYVRDLILGSSNP
jgi:hypothetical protein